jgi:Flp pilus assembly protein TadB
MKAKSEHWRMAMLVIGWSLLVVAPIVGLLPGPGGIFVFAAGLVLLLRNSAWVRRHYAKLKRRFPKAGHICDHAMRRPSALRRREVAKARVAQAD